MYLLLGNLWCSFDNASVPGNVSCSGVYYSNFVNILCLNDMESHGKGSVLFTEKGSVKTKSTPVKSTYSSGKKQLIYKADGPGKKEHLFYRTPPSGCFCLNYFNL